MSTNPTDKNNTNKKYSVFADFAIDHDATGVCVPIDGEDKHKLKLSAEDLYSQSPGYSQEPKKKPGQPKKR